MCKYSLLKELKRNGTLKAAINTGLISTSVIGHQDIYEYYLKIRPKYKGKMTAVTVVSEDKKICEKTVRNIIKDFGC